MVPVPVGLKGRTRDHASMSLITYRIEREGATRLLFLMHGWSAEQHHLAAYVPLVDPEERFSAVCPRGPHDLPEGDGASWYDRSDGTPDPDDFRSSVGLIDELIAAECARAGLTTEQCVFGGFSQGGFLSLALAGRSGAPRFGGVWAMCCTLREVPGLVLDLEAAAGTPVLIQYGEKDRIIAPEQTRNVAKQLSEAGWLVTEESYDMAHSQTIEMMVDARAWLSALP